MYLLIEVRTLTNDLLTELAISSRVSIFVRQYFRFAKPKHQSGANFVWPTGRNVYSIFLCNPAFVLHDTYVTRFAKTGHNSAFTEIHFIAP